MSVDTFEDWFKTLLFIPGLVAVGALPVTGVYGLVGPAIFWGLLSFIDHWCKADEAFWAEFEEQNRRDPYRN